MGWWGDDSDDLDHVVRLVRGSYCCCVALCEEQVVGMGRVISDGVSDSYVQDVAVHPDFRGRGIASEIVSRLVSRLRGDGLTWIALIAERGSAALYVRHGFHPMRDSVPLILEEH